MNRPRQRHTRRKGKTLPREGSTEQHIVLIHRYFWPDTPMYAHILKSIAVRLGEEGHKVTVLTCQPSYNRAVVDRASAREVLAPGVTVRRWHVFDDRRSSSLKVVNLVTFCARLLMARRTLGSINVVMAASTPPVAVAKVASWLARASGARFVYHKQDIYPEVVTAPGILRKPRLAALLRWVDSRTDRAAARVIVLSQDMAKTVQGRGVSSEQVETINNFDPWTVDGSIESDSPPLETPRSSGVFDVVFAGNLGRFQNLETVIAVATEMRKDPGVIFHFYGDGALRPSIEQAVESQGLANVRLYGYRPPSEIADFLQNRADLGIVSLEPGVIEAAYPSKTMSYLRQGCPVLALVESHSELARMLESTGAGRQADPGDVGGVVSTLRDLRSNPDGLRSSREAAAAVYRERFSSERQLEEWARLFHRLGTKEVR